MVGETLSPLDSPLSQLHELLCSGCAASTPKHVARKRSNLFTVCDIGGESSGEASGRIIAVRLNDDSCAIRCSESLPESLPESSNREL